MTKTRSTSRIVLLIGLRGSGKSTIGRSLAAALSWSFEDLDLRALQLSGATSIPEVFAAEGEDGWRRHEASALAGALERDDLVLALGGGAPMVDAIRERIEEERAKGRLRVFWLDAPDEILAGRLTDHGTGRPALLHDAKGDPLGPLEECRALRSRRSATFAAISDRRIESGDTPEEVLERLLGSL